MLLLFYFLIAWKEPFPPIPSYGIELSFGLENTGTGDRPLSSPTPVEEVQEMSEESESSEVDVSEEVIDEDAEFIDTPLEEVVEEAETPIADQPSPDVVKEQTTVTEDVNPVKKKLEEPQQNPVETAKEEVPKEPELNPAAAMPQSTNDANSTKGDDANAGAAGKKEGDIDGRGLMGEQGGANGASLQMAGWVWDFKPQPKDNSTESGKIVYKIKIDGDGYIIGIEVVSSTVSPTVQQYYRQSVERLSFSKTNEYTSAPTSSGTITFIIRSK